MKYQPRDTPKTDMVKVRVSPNLKTAIKARAEAEGITMGRWIVEMASDALEPSLGRTCAWCSTVITKGREVTHTICPDCYEKEMAEMEER